MSVERSTRHQNTPNLEQSSSWHFAMLLTYLLIVFKCAFDTQIQLTYLLNCYSIICSLTQDVDAK